VRLVIAGVPNAGKSSLLNRILGYERAIVTDIPGTTRDTVEETALIRGIQFRVTDTAGLRDGEVDTVEAFGIARSKDSLKSAELVIWLLDPEQDSGKQLAEMRLAAEQTHAAVIPCWNKLDEITEKGIALPPRYELAVSARTGDGMEALFDRIEGAVRSEMNERESDTAVAQRHEALLKTAKKQLEAAVPELRAEDWELAAVRIREALRALGTVTGENASPDVLDEIFSRFCIGK